MRTRRAIQALSLVLFLSLFFSAAWGFVGSMPHDLVLRLDPLAALVVLLAVPAAAGAFVMAVATAAGALVAGRAFCGYVCPLGSVLDGGARLVGARRGLPAGLRALTGLKECLLVVTLVAAAAGFSLVSWLDPLVLFSRSLALLADPWLEGAGGMALEILRPAFVRLDWVALSNASLENPRYWLTGLSAAWLGAIVGLSLWRARFWCRILCPLGALLGALGRWAPVGRRVTDACIDCGACARTCPMEAVGEDPRGTLQEACIRCRRCADACPTAAIRFLPAPGGGLPARMASPVLSRRGALAAGVAGLLVGITSPLDAGRAAPRDRLIRPPGALPEGEFLDQCLRCGLCMGACMSHTLQPTLWEAGLDGVWTPRLDLRLAPCEKNCNRCGLVCPTGAIRPLELMERTHAKIGTAVLLRERCLVWEQDKVCLVCDEICPYDAIEFRDVDGRRRPFVTESRCNGCGYCEHKCPVQGESAIIVSRAGELRLASGSYVEAARERGYAFEGPRPDEAPAPAPGADGGLPTGLIRKDP